MYYLVQSNILSDPDHHKIFGVLEELGLAYEAIELKGDVLPEGLCGDRTDVFVYGSVKLARLAAARTDWWPGSFYGGNHRHEASAPQYGPHLLNAETEVFPFSQSITWQPGDRKFIKPHRDAKVFTGRVFQEAEWLDFVAENLAQPRTPQLHGGTHVQASAPQHIIKEARLWIVGGSVVEAVYYRFHGDQPWERTVAPEGIAFAQQMVRTFEVAEAFVMDICLTAAGWRIVEINCINSAGLYHANIRTILRALEMYFG